MRRNSLILAAVGGAAALAVTGAALGVGAADRTGRPAGGAALTAVAATSDDRPAGDDRSTTATTGAPAAGQVTRDRAGRIALDAVGQGRIVKIEAESEHARSVWRVDIVAGSRTYEVDVDRSTGAVGRVRQEAADDRRGGGSDDRPGADHRRGSGARDDHPSADDHGGSRPARPLRRSCT
ncbi:PepSY domain-containing protein [Micromonospora olivasterospora]|uniref:Peptidase YpeB-like protein n=1 Tax=Micromonospora olivasterospora TaxID=1880 RepID=A0A562ICE1_MICOL|nr:PepSY domain-containing protein [Micromonospora olivasterospora]TWH68657.1 peptidase YpeB-like protein [Micromonospora olivasterospora]